MTPIHSAAACGDSRILEFLIEDAHAQVDAVDKQGGMPSDLVDQMRAKLFFNRLGGKPEAIKDQMKKYEKHVVLSFFPDRLLH